MSSLLLILLALIAGRVEEWDHYTHLGNISSVAIDDETIICGSSGGIIFLRYDPDENIIFQDSTWTYPGKLSHSSVRSLFLEENGSLWVGTYGGGIDRYSAEGAYTHFGQLEGLPLSLKVTSILVDSSVWVGTTEGLAIKELGYFVTWDIYSTGGGLSSNNINCLAMSDSGLWVGTNSGVSLLRTGSDPGSSTSWETFPEVSGISFLQIVVQNDTTWAATEDGLFLKNESSNSWEEETAFSGSFPQCISFHGEKMAVGAEAGIYCRIEGKWYLFDEVFGGSMVFALEWLDGIHICAGRGWMYTDDRSSGPGISIGFGNIWKTYLPNSSPSNDLLSTCVDSYEACWVASDDNGSGALNNSSENWTAFNSTLINNKQLNSCTADREGGVITACYHYGATWIDWNGTSTRTDDQAISWSTENSGLINNDILCVEFVDNTVWFGHETYFEAGSPPGGVSRLQWTPGDSSSTVWQGWLPVDGLPSDRISEIAAIDSDNAWLGSDVGLVRLDATTGNIWPDTPIDMNNGLPSNQITALVLTLDGCLYIGTAGGLALLPANTDYAEVIPEIEGFVECLIFDYKSNLWVGTTEGIYQISPDNSVELYNILNSPLLTTEIRDLSSDNDKGYIYAVTDHGLWRLQVGDGLVSTPYGAVLYPNPFVLNGTNITRLAGVENIPTTVRIFDLCGRLVYESSTPDRDSFYWDGVDLDGNNSSSGTYIVMITQENMNSLFKLAIVR